MSYRILIVRRAQKQLASLSLVTYERIKAAIVNLGDQPRPVRSMKLTSREGWRIRVGDYRVIYDINDSEQSVTVLEIGHRGDVYR